MNDSILISRTDTAALLFDLDGTIINNMEFHNRAWQMLFAEMGLDWTLDRVKREIWGKNEEIFARVFPGRFSQEEVKELTNRKELSYIEQYRPHIRMIDGLETLLEQAQSLGLKLAVATAAPTVCVNFVFDALQLSRYFKHVVHADLVTKSKPHPETFLTAATLVNEPTKRCLVFEDAPVGVRACSAADMESVVILATHEKREFSGFTGIRGFISDYRDVRIVD